jgi:MFS family permease
MNEALKKGKEQKSSDDNDYFIRYKLLYFIVFSGLGVIFPYFPVYFESLAFSKTQIGILCMMPNFCSFLIAPIFSILGDIWHCHYELMIISLLVSTIAVLAILPFSSFVAVASIVLVGSIMRAPLTPQIDALVMATLTKKSRYGEMRLWGAISYGIFSLVAGLLTSKPTTTTTSHGVPDHTSFRLIFYLHALFFFSGGFLLLYLVNKLQITQIMSSIERRDLALVGKQPTLPTEEELGDEGGEKKETVKEEIKEKLTVVAALYRVFRNNSEVYIFSVVVFLSGFGSGVIDSFLFLRLAQLGGSGTVMGISRFITCAAEVPMFQIAGFLQDRLGVWPLMTLTQFAFVIRFTYYSWLTNPWYVLPCEMLHGLTFAIMWSVSCSYANMISPIECHSSMQALLEGLHWGFGSGMGALIGGFAYDRFGAVRLFEASGVLSGCSLLLAGYVSYRDYHNNNRDRETASGHHRDYSHVEQIELPVRSPLIFSDSSHHDDL